MTSQFAKSVSSHLAMALVGIYCTLTLAEVYDITELQQPDNDSPAMSGFYTVTPDGETILEDPVESGFAISAGSDFDPQRSPEEEPDPDSAEKQPETKSDSNRKNRETRTVRVRVKRKPPERSRADQFQCERHGFYYTNDGRCILPAYQHYLPAIPHPHPGGGMHPVLPD